MEIHLIRVWSKTGFTWAQEKRELTEEDFTRIIEKVESLKTILFLYFKISQKKKETRGLPSQVLASTYQGGDGTTPKLLLARKVSRKPI